VIARPWPALNVALLAEVRWRFHPREFSITTRDAPWKITASAGASDSAASSWGEGGYWKVWLNENNEWIYRHLRVAQERMTALTRRFPHPDALTRRALKQAARELLLAQASDWPFILRTGTSPQYATRRVKDHLLRFHALHEQLTLTRVDENWLDRVEWLDNIFPEVQFRYWA
jgi:1,4-alpha-glucan branching enzyme